MLSSFNGTLVQWRARAPQIAGDLLADVGFLLRQNVIRLVLVALVQTAFAHSGLLTGHEQELVDGFCTLVDAAILAAIGALHAKRDGRVVFGRAEAERAPDAPNPSIADQQMAQAVGVAP